MDFKNQRLNLWWTELDFGRLTPRACLAAFLFPHFENFWLARLIRTRLQIETRRSWLFALGSSWVGGLASLMILATVSHFLSYGHCWEWIFASARSTEPPDWIFALGDARPEGLLFCVILGLIPALVTGLGFWAWWFAPAALFAGVLSFPGGWALVLAERLALWIRFQFVTKDRVVRRDLAWRSLASLTTLAILFVVGPALRNILESFWAEQRFNPEGRLFIWGLGLAILILIETILAHLIMHLRSLRTSRDRFSSFGSVRLGRVASPWDQELLFELRRKSDWDLAEDSLT